MGVLTSMDGMRRRVLAPSTSIGRLESCELRLANPRVSGRHAVLRWRQSGWEIKDLGSRNGTAVAGRRLEPGIWQAVEQGTSMAFGDSNAPWLLEDAGAPILPMAVPLDSGAVRVGADGVLLLPDDDTPEAFLRQRDGHWVLEQAEADSPIHNEGLISIAGRPYRIFLPTVTAETVDAATREVGVLAFTFTVSLDEESVSLVAHRGPQKADLDTRAHHYTLLTLARRRLEDRQQEIPTGEEGWIYRDDLMRMLDLDRVQLNMHIYRARKQLAASSLAFDGPIIERRASTQQIRLGVSLLQVRRAT